MRLAYIIIVVFSFLVANLPLPIYLDAENPSIYFNISESSNRNCDDCEYDWSDYGSHLEPPRELRSMQKLVKI